LIIKTAHPVCCILCTHPTFETY